MKLFSADNWIQGAIAFLLCLAQLLSASAHDDDNNCNVDPSYEETSEWEGFLNEASFQNVEHGKAISELYAEVSDMKSKCLRFRHQYVRSVFAKDVSVQEEEYGHIGERPWLFEKNYTLTGSRRDFLKVMKAGYINFQRVAIAFEFVYKDMHDDKELYVDRQGRFWNLAREIAIKIVQKIYITIRDQF